MFMKAWLNGNLVDWNETNLSVLSHSFSRGSGIFEVVDIVKTVNGPAFFGLQEHMERFFNSARLTYMELPLSKEELITAVMETARANNISFGASKFFAYYPEIEMRLIPSNPQVSVAIFSVDFNVFGITQEELSAPISAGISKFRKNHPEAVPVHAKVVGNYVNSYLAQMEVMKRGYDEAILLDTMGFVAEGPSANIFFVAKDTVFTPYIRSALPGINRMAIMEALEEMKCPIKEKDIPVEDLMDFSEAFFSSSIIKIHPIRSIGKRALGISCPGPVTAALINKMDDVYSGKVTTFEKWMLYL
jgi:branched-chain amino acid aminotransferase